MQYIYCDTLVDERLIDESRTMDNVRAFDTEQNDLTMTAFAREMLDSGDEIPDEVRQRQFGFLGKDTILTKFDSEDTWQTANDIAIARNWDIMSVPAYSKNINEMVDNEQVRRRMMCQSKRGSGGFERTSLTTSVKEIKTSPLPREVGGGIVAGLKRKLGMDKTGQELTA